MNIQYREPSTKEELEAIFRLRLETYAQDPELYSMINNSNSLDINEYDQHSMHFAAFIKNQPIACIRLTGFSKTHFSAWVNEMINENELIISETLHPFPFQNYYPDTKWSNEFISGLKSRQIGEVGKLAIHKNHRRGGIILDGLIHSFVSYCKNDQKIDTGFGSCTLKLERYYRKFGFVPVEGAIPFVYKGLPEALIVRFDK